MLSFTKMVPVMYWVSTWAARVAAEPRDRKDIVRGGEIGCFATRHIDRELTFCRARDRDAAILSSKFEAGQERQSSF